MKNSHLLNPESHKQMRSSYPFMHMLPFLVFLLSFLLLFVSWPPDLSIQAAGKIIKKENKPYPLNYKCKCFKEACVRIVKMIIFPPYKSSSSIMCNSHGRGWKGDEMMHSISRLVAGRVFFQLQCWSMLLTIVQMTVFVAPLSYLRNDHLLVRGPCESHYPWFNWRWQEKGMERKDITWQALCFLMSLLSPGVRLTAPTLIKNPQSNKSNQASSASNHGIMFCFLGSHLFTHWCAPWRAAYQLCAG